MNILAKFKETAVSVLPVMAIVLLLGFTIVPLDKYLLARFVVGGLLLIIGLTIFLLGVDLGIQPMGERCGAELTKKRSLTLLLIVAFIIGFIVTAAEPDIQVFGDQVRSLFPFVKKISITFVIAGGVGLFIMLGLLRTVLNLSIKWTFFIAYALLFAVLHDLLGFSHVFIKQALRISLAYAADTAEFFLVCMIYLLRRIEKCKKRIYFT